MFRTLTGIGFALALVGSVHAEQRVVISTAGQSQAQIRTQIYKAAQAVCNNSDMAYSALQSGLDESCVNAAYHDGLRQLYASRVQKVGYASPNPRTASTQP